MDHSNILTTDDSSPLFVRIDEMLRVFPAELWDYVPEEFRGHRLPVKDWVFVVEQSTDDAHRLSFYYQKDDHRALRITHEIGNKPLEIVRVYSDDRVWGVINPVLNEDRHIFNIVKRGYTKDGVRRDWIVD